MPLVALEVLLDLSHLTTRLPSVTTSPWLTPMVTQLMFLAHDRPTSPRAVYRSLRSKLDRCTDWAGYVGLERDDVVLAGRATAGSPCAWASTDSGSTGARVLAQEVPRVVGVDDRARQPDWPFRGMSAALTGPQPRLTLTTSAISSTRRCWLLRLGDRRVEPLRGRGSSNSRSLYTGT